MTELPRGQYERDYPIKGQTSTGRIGKRTIW